MAVNLTNGAACPNETLKEIAMYSQSLLCNDGAEKLRGDSGSRYDASGPLASISTLDRRERIAKQIYTPLQQWETRVLAVHPSAGDDELVADLHPVIVTHFERGFGVPGQDRILEYEALSYTWRAPELTASILCNGHSLMITPNLAEALRHLRLPSSTRYVWADALCVNQYDEVEKARQITNLFAIFQKATRVIVWLGDAIVCTGVGLEFLNECKERNFDRREIGTLGYGHLSSKAAEQCGPGRTKYDLINEVLWGLLDLAQRPWCRRAWIA